MTKALRRGVPTPSSDSARNALAGVLAAANEPAAGPAGASAGPAHPHPHSHRRPQPAAAAQASVGRKERENSVDEIHEKIYVAILEHRLRPGTKLGEEKMADIFGVGRARIREVLARLAHEQIVELVPQRGAYVARPTIEQARDVFEARRLIEPAVLRRLVDSLTPEKTQRLRRHVELEHDARRRGDKRAVIRLSGEFHTLLAELAGNSALARTMHRLCMLTCLTIFLYDAPTAQSCRDDEHQAIVDAVERRDRSRAEALMQHHLDHIEGSLQLDHDPGEADLEAIFGP
jgi:DNA-binding GntR family transcriptional regulator